MSTSKLPNIPSLRRQQLRLEFASLRTTPPPGVYASISPTDPAQWSGVLFIQKGPYASAILRFQIRFPPTYPDLPPLITFNTDIFHPLVVPLTTYTFTTGSSDSDTVSATDEERLPPGGFSLRHGFPHWFGRAKRSAENSVASSRNVSSNEPGDKKTVDSSVAEGRKEGDEGAGGPTTPKKQSGEQESTPKVSISAPTTDSSHVRASPVPSGAPYSSPQIDIPVLSVLNYVRSTFDDEAVLDSIPLEAAGNPGAWHGWKSHRRAMQGESIEPSGEENSADSKAKKGKPQARPPGQWNWEGVWAERVQSGIQTSYLESVLFGNTGRGGDDLIRFNKLDHSILTRVKEEMISTQEEGQTEA